MYNKFKVKKKIISIALALIMTASSVASLPMNAFAGTVYAGKRKNAATTASPYVVYDFDIENVIRLDSGRTFDVNYRVENVRPQGATVSYTVESQTAFVDGKNVFDADGKVQNPGLAKVKVTVGNVSKEAYIVAGDVNEILSYANDARLDAFYSLWGGLWDGYDSSWGRYDSSRENYNYPDNIRSITPVDPNYGCYRCDGYYASNDCAHAVAYAVARANGSRKRGMEDEDYYGTYSAAKAAYRSAWIRSYKSNVDDIVRKIVADYRKARLDEPEKKNWLYAAYAAAKAAKEMTDKYKGVHPDLETKLKLAHMSYRIAQLDWLYNEKEGTSVQANACGVKADALQEMIDKVYANKVGDIEDQVAKI